MQRLLSGQVTKLHFFTFDEFFHVLDLTFQFSAELFQLINLLKYTHVNTK